MKPLALAALAMLAAAPVQAQLRDRVALGAGAASTALGTDAGGTKARLTGISALASGRFGVSRFALEGFYREGKLSPDSGAGSDVDLVEARLLATYRPLAWLQVGAGPHARAYVVPGSTTQWTFIEARARAEGTMLADILRSHVELWAALSASSNAGSSGSARGGEAGVTLRLPRSPVWARLSYSIDRASYSTSGQNETLEDVTLSIGFGRP